MHPANHCDSQTILYCSGGRINESVVAMPRWGGVGGGLGRREGLLVGVRVAAAAA